MRVSVSTTLSSRRLLLRRINLKDRVVPTHLRAQTGLRAALTRTQGGPERSLSSLLSAEGRLFPAPTGHRTARSLSSLIWEMLSELSAGVSVGITRLDKEWQTQRALCGVGLQREGVTSHSTPPLELMVWDQLLKPSRLRFP